ILSHASHREFQRCVARYDGDRRARRLRCWDQFLIMSFAQLSFRESLRDIEACLRARPEKHYHMGIRSGVSRNTLAVANENRGWRTYADFAQALTPEAQQHHAGARF